MRNILILFCLAWTCRMTAKAAVFHRGDKISEHFKQLYLAPEEIDPDVAPLPPNRIEMIDDTTDDILIVNDENEILDETENEIIDESANEIPHSEVTAAPEVSTTEAPVTVAAPVETSTPIKAEEPSGLAKYCKCKGNNCDCCRTFTFPFIPVKGPACARMSYLGNEKMSISLKYGDLTLASRTVSSRRSRPICVTLPGGYSQFCGRLYGLSKASENFKACLGFELRADDEIEAALRVSCFKFGSEGLRVADPEPFPVESNKEEDDDDDIFGFTDDADDEEEEEDYEEDDEEESEDDADTDYADDEAEEEETPVDADYGGFSLAGILDELDDDDDEDSKPSSSTPAVASLTSASNAVTRTALDAVQSKDDKGTAAATTIGVTSTETETPAALTATANSAVANQVTPAPENTADTTAKTKKSKKSKKNKKKKAADVEGDFAYELINGLLDLFN